MSIVAQKSGCRVGWVWYDSEAEADAVAAEVVASPSAAAANVGIAQVGREPGAYCVCVP